MGTSRRLATISGLLLLTLSGCIPGVITFDTPADPSGLRLPAQVGIAKTRYTFSNRDPFSSDIFISNPLKETFVVIAPTSTVRLVSCDATRTPYNQVIRDKLESLGDNLHQLMTHRKYDVVGPRTSLDDLLFAEKDRVLLALVANVSVTVSCLEEAPPTLFAESPASSNEEGDESTAPRTRISEYRGELEVATAITFYLVETQSRENIWRQPLDSQRRRSYSYYTFETLDENSPAERAAEVPPVYDGRNKTLSDLLDTSLDDVLNALWTELDPSEIGNVVEQANMARAQAK